MAESTSGKSNSKIPSQGWRRDYEAVLRETDVSALFKLVEIAEAAILTRRDALGSSPNHDAERQEIGEALKHLEDVKRKRLKFGGG